MARKIFFGFFIIALVVIMGVYFFAVDIAEKMFFGLLMIFGVAVLGLFFAVMALWGEGWRKKLKNRKISRVPRFFWWVAGIIGGLIVVALMGAFFWALIPSLLCKLIISLTESLRKND